MRLVFDLDGCVVDTYEAHREAYALAGFEYGPQHYHGGSSTWATAEQRRIKGENFRACLERHGKILPCGELLLRYGYGATVVSACSQATYLAFLDVFPKFRLVPIYYGMSESVKVGYLNAVSETGIYFDDWSVMLDKVRKETKWQVIDASRF